MAPAYRVLPLARSMTSSAEAKSCEDGWWMTHATVRPLFDTDLSACATDMDDTESSPLENEIFSLVYINYSMYWIPINMSL